MLTWLRNILRREPPLVSAEELVDDFWNNCSRTSTSVVHEIRTNRSYFRYREWDADLYQKHARDQKILTIYSEPVMQVAIISRPTMLVSGGYMPLTEKYKWLHQPDKMLATKLKLVM